MSQTVEYQTTTIKLHYGIDMQCIVKLKKEKASCEVEGAG